ncbi:hypothetical protein MKX03_016887, partial [Papaver bracteatum]
MEMMYYGMRNADRDNSNRFVHLMGTSESPTHDGTSKSPDKFSLKGKFDDIMKSGLKAYMRWARSDDNVQQSELLDALQSAGWCTVQVFTIHLYF